MRTFSIAEASDYTGLTPKAIRRRVERGTLRSTLDRAGLRRIPLSELEPYARDPEGQGHPRGTPAGHSTGLDLSTLLERLEALAAENGALRQLEQRAGSLERQVAVEREARERAETALFEARARMLAYESRPRRWWRRRAAGDAPAEAPAPAVSPARASPA